MEIAYYADIALMGPANYADIIPIHAFSKIVRHMPPLAYRKALYFKKDDVLHLLGSKSTITNIEKEIKTIESPPDQKDGLYFNRLGFTSNGHINLIVITKNANKLDPDSLASVDILEEVKDKDLQSMLHNLGCVCASYHAHYKY